MKRINGQRIWERTTIGLRAPSCIEVKQIKSACNRFLASRGLDPQEMKWKHPAFGRKRKCVNDF